MIQILLAMMKSAAVIDKLKTYSKSKLKEHKLSSNEWDKAVHDAHLLKTLLNPTNI